MIILIILSTLINVAIAKSVICHACLNKICHRKATVFEARHFSGQLAIDRTNNFLYFHYKNHLSKDFTGLFDLDDIKFHIIPNINFTFGHTVNQETREVYMSGDHGIYRYNPTKNKTELYGLPDKTVWHLQYYDTLYYSQFQTKGLSTLSNKKTSQAIAPLSNYYIDDFIIDKLGDIYFLSNQSTYVLKKGAKEAAIFEDEIYFLSTDYNSEAYFIQPYTRAIYKLDYSIQRLETVGALDRGLLMKIVFDANNNIIYLDGLDKKLYYLMPNFNKCSVITGQLRSSSSGKQGRRYVELVME